MIINKPYVEVRNDRTFLISVIRNDINNVEEEFFFSVPNDYGKYLCHENADAFVVSMLVPALMSGQDIKVKAPISEMLFYGLDNLLIYLLSKVFDRKPIKVLADSIGTFDFNTSAVVTAFSGGIDSFTTVLQHTSDECSAGMRLTHLSLFNVGAYGNDSLGAQNSFNADALRAKQFADHIHMPIILLDSNISKAYEVREITHGYSPRSGICIMAGVLSLQKLIRIYLIASSNTIDEIKLSKWEMDYYESVVAYYLSSFNTKIIIANDNLKRIEKVKLIAGNELVQKFLYVCPADYLNEKSDIKFLKDTKPNCSECTKCMRTLIVLDVLGYLDKYAERFDLNKYAIHKTNYLKYLLCNINENVFFRGIYNLMIERNYQFPQEVRRHLRARRIKDKVTVFSAKSFRYVNHRIIKSSISFLARKIRKIFSSKSQSIEKFRITGSKI